jgi:hypothetical protein
MPLPQDVVDDMQNDARKHHRDNGFVRMPDGSFVPEHFVRDTKNPNVQLTAEQIREKMERRKPLS